MVRKKKKLLLVNSVSSLAVQAMAILSSFIVPRCILSSFGSVINGTVESIGGFLGFLTLLEAGVGSVSRAELYRPVAAHDIHQTSAVVNETRHFFRKIARIYLASVIVFSLIYPSFARNEESFTFNLTLVLVVAITNIVQYYFGAGYIQVLYADQKIYLLNYVQAGAYLLNCIVVYVCARLGTGIHVLKLASTVPFIIKPIFTNIYVRCTYKIDKTAKSETTVLKQKWNNMLQTLAYYVHRKTDVVVLAVLSSGKAVSVYAVHALISNGLSSVLSSLCYGFTAKLGAQYGSSDEAGVKETFRVYDFFIYNATLLSFMTAELVIVDFIGLYTRGVNDANYNQPLFAAILLLAEAVYCFRMPYNNMVSVAGHFKQTQNAALIEAFLNIGLSLVLVNFWGITGVAVGTLIAMSYRTVYLARYLTKNILHLDRNESIKKVLACGMVITLSKVVGDVALSGIVVTSFAVWTLKTVAAFVIVLACCAVADLIFYRDTLKNCRRFIRRQ